jgi:hypothetical protein
MTYLTLLPDELYRLITTYMYAETMCELLTVVPLVKDMWPPPELWFILQNGSDHVRSASLNNRFRRHRVHYRESDWYKLLIDMERPCVCQRSCMNIDLSPWLMRRQKVVDFSASGLVWWSSCKEPTRLSYAGWCRLTEEV